MSIFGNIMSKIFGTHAEAAPAGGAAQAGGGSGAPAGTSSSPPAAGAGGTTASSSASAPSATGGAQVDVAKVLSDLAAKHSEKLDWKHSIVDLLKLLGMDSSLTARKTLADELHYTGDKEDSATMNMWLSKQVMTKLAENGGKIPDDLKH